MARLDFRGAAAKLTATGSIADDATSIDVDGDTSGWPTGASGRNFAVTIDRGVAGKMEKVLCSALSGSTLNIVERGYDGTTPLAHDANCTVEHGLTAGVLDDLSQHVYDTDRDDHTQYVRVDGSRGFASIDDLVGVPSAVGTANAEGISSFLSRADHVHDIADNAVGTAQLATGAVTADEIAANAVGASELANNAVDTAAVADDAVTNAKLANDAVDTLQIVDEAVTRAKLDPEMRFEIGSFTGVTSGSGVSVMPHGCPYTPSAVNVQPILNGGWGANRGYPMVTNIDATNITVQWVATNGSMAAVTVVAQFSCFP